MGMPWQPMHIEIFPFAASAFPVVCACACRTMEENRSAATVLIIVSVCENPGDSMSKPLREAMCQRQADGVRDPLAHFLRAHPHLLVAVDDHAGLEQHGGRSRGLEHDEVVVVVHAVLLVGERLLLPGDGVGVVE